jgi:endonuclease/exonuclease/phosphatase family metal-dependent hydrolase
MVLGDFNSTGEIDRKNLTRFAIDTGLHWATRELGCTAYWQPKNECLGSALDHVFTSRPAHEAAARGPCESVGCEPGDSCPVFYDEVSDHCPVTVAF